MPLTFCRSGIYMKDTAVLRDFLKTPRKIVITTHANPDADALGSSLGLYHFLVKKGHNIKVIVPTSYPDFLEWMPGNSLVINYENEIEQCDAFIKECDLIFCLDFSGYKRIKKMSDSVVNASAKIALVDHHLNPEIEPDFNFWDDEAAATAELIFDLISDHEGKESINKDISECLYAGIMTDTGSFKHSNTTAKIHRIVADLIDLGADVCRVSRSVYDTNSLERLQFLGHALAEKLSVDIEARVAYFIIEESNFENFKLKQGDTEGLVNYALSIKDIVMAAIIIERDGEIKLSFRSVGDVAVNKFAEEYFSGGGHKNASGGISDLPLKETEEKFKELIKKDVLKTRR